MTYIYFYLYLIGTNGIRYCLAYYPLALFMGHVEIFVASKRKCGPRYKKYNTISIYFASTMQKNNLSICVPNFLLGLYLGLLLYLSYTCNAGYMVSLQ